MQQYNNYVCINKQSGIPIVTLFIKLAHEYDINMFKYNYDALQEFVIEKNKINDVDFQFFNSFFEISMRKYTALLYEGGPDVSPDNLVWSYYNYLSQVSMWLS